MRFYTLFFRAQPRKQMTNEMIPLLKCVSCVFVGRIVVVIF